MTLKQLEAFYWAATLNNFALAAERLHITQSALSKRIAELEEHLLHELFDRSKRKAELTESGQVLLPQVEELLALVNGIPQSLAGDQDSIPLSGVCRIGLSELSSATWLPKAIDRFRLQHPDLLLEPHIFLSRELEDLVLRGELDVAVIAGLPESDSIAYEKIAEIEFSWVASPRRALRSNHLTPELLQQIDVLMHQPNSGLAPTIKAWLRNKNIKLERVILCNSLTAITGMVVADMGISYLPSAYVQPLLKKGKLVELYSEPALQPLHYTFIWLKNDPRRLLRVVKKSLHDCIDFSLPPVLWVE